MEATILNFGTLNLEGKRCWFEKAGLGSTKPSRSGLASTQPSDHICRVLVASDNVHVKILVWDIRDHTAMLELVTSNPHLLHEKFIFVFLALHPFDKNFLLSQKLLITDSLSHFLSV